MSSVAPTPENAGASSVLRRNVWPRTLRPALAAVMLPGLRGRMGQKHINAQIARTGLPADVVKLVQRVTASTRLWPAERAEVARELCAHFQDGFAGGVKTEDLVRDFGDHAIAARMIRRSKKRGRPAAYRAMVRVVQGLGLTCLLLMAAYGYFAARYYWGRPSITRNYAAELNKPILSAPPDARAWPVYVEAVRAFGSDPEWMRAVDSNWPAAPGQDGWDRARAWLDEHHDAIELVRRGAQRPMIGYVYSNATDRTYMELKTQGVPDAAFETARENPLLMGILLPHLGEMRRFARVLTTDARAAVESGDRARVMADLEAMMGIASQGCEEPFLISRLVGCAVGMLAFNEARAAIAAKDLLTSDDRVRLAHIAAGIGGGRVSLASEAEAMTYDDLLQRVYSDNGNGDGHLLASALDEIHTDFGIANPGDKPLGKAVMPVVAAWTPSRRELKEQMDRVIAAGVRDDQLPPHHHTQRTSGQEMNRMYAMCRGPMQLFSVFGGTDSSQSRVYWSRDRFETGRDALMVACALESYRAEKGTYPQRLEDLTPGLLPRLPRDPYDGQPLRYRLKDGQPLLYSIGADMIDDAGAPPAKDVQVTEAPGEDGKSPRGPGDWVLYPMPRDRK